jgi:hypothetical protein
MALIKMCVFKPTANDGKMYFAVFASAFRQELPPQNHLSLSCNQATASRILADHKEQVAALEPYPAMRESTPL